jgi:hypothetical protein
MRSTIALLALLAPLGASAQQLELPRPSPFAKVVQTVGLTDITVDYSSPAVKGRKIWGGLVPFDELWRTGANHATKITFSKDVTVAGKAVPAGTYAIFTIPARESWTVILNKNPNQDGTRDYKKDLDQLRFTVKPAAAPPRERMTFLFSDFTDSAATLDLEWEKLRVSIPIQLATDAQAAANIKAMADGSWRPYTSAARYYLDKKEYDAGLPLVDKALSIKEDWLSLWTKAQLLAGKGNYKQAYPLAERANELGKKSEVFFYKDDVKKALADWKGKS